MAVPTYTSDLATINDCSSTSTPDTWAEPTGMTAGTTIAAQTDFYIEGSSCISKVTNATGTSGVGFPDAGGATTLPSGEAFWFWVYHVGAKALDTRANGGLQVIVGNTLANYYAYYLEGNDTYVIGGWKRVPIDPTLTGNDADGFAFRNRTQGSPSGSWAAYGVGCVQLAAVAGAGMGIDHVAYGRDLLVEFGSTADGYATFSSTATNDATNARGQFQFNNGAYYQQGLLILGSATNAVDFRDTAGAAVFIEKTPKVASGFNEIEIRNASSRVDWGAVSFTSLGNQSRGKLTITDNADVNISGCSFTGMDTFSLQAGTDILTSTFRGCNAITAPGSNLSGTQVLVPTVAANTSAVIWNVNTDPNGKLDDMTFSKGTNAHHAIEFGNTIPADITLTGCTFSGFSASQDNNASIFHFKDTTGTITINLVGCTSDVAFDTSYRTDGATIIVVQDPVTTLINIKDEEGNNEQDVRVYLEAADATGDLPYQKSITSITRSDTTATVTFGSAHGLKTGEYLKLSGITDKVEDLSGAFQVTVTNATVLTYQTTNSGSTSYLGTILGTGATIYGTTDASGNISSSRTYTLNQPLTGFARKVTDGVTPPFYKTIELIDTVSSTTGLTLNRRLVLDQ